MPTAKVLAGKRQRSARLLSEFQRVFADMVNAEAQPRKMLARILRLKLKAQGIAVKPDELPALEDAAERMLASGKDGTFALDIESMRGVAQSLSISLDADDVKSSKEDFLKALEETIPSMAKSMSKSLLRGLRKTWPQTLAGLRAEIDYSRQRLRAHWAPAFDQLAVHIAVAAEIRDMLSQLLSRRKKSANLVRALLLLHARACSTAHEVHALLEAGFPDGALARWRTIHEAGAIAAFLKAHGDTVAERYLLHQDVETLRALKKYNELAPLHGWAAMSQRDVKHLERRVARLVARFGGGFARHYGWASEALGNKRTTFADIEKAAELTYARPHYQMASGVVHVGPEEMILKAGLVADSELIVLPGISEAGLDVAGRVTAHSIGMMTIDLLMLYVTLDALVWMEVMLGMTLETGKAFEKCQRYVERRTH